MLGPGDYLVERKGGCICNDPRCPARRPQAGPQVLNMSVDVGELARTQRIDPRDAAAVGAAAYRAAANGSVRIREKERERLPDFISAEAPGRTIFIPTNGMADVHEMWATVGELLAEQASSYKQESWNAYREGERVDVVQQHREFNEALLKYARGNTRTVKQRSRYKLKGQSAQWVGEKRGR